MCVVATEGRSRNNRWRQIWGCQNEGLDKNWCLKGREQPASAQAWDTKGCVPRLAENRKQEPGDICKTAPSNANIPYHLWGTSHLLTTVSLLSFIAQLHKGVVGTHCHHFHLPLTPQLTIVWLPPPTHCSPYSHKWPPSCRSSWTLFSPYLT